jgi:hypothetical protein
MSLPLIKDKAMKTALPMELPKCAEHGSMELQPAGTQEQEFCGTWYRCSRCTNSVLLTSPALEAQLSTKAAKIAKWEAELARIKCSYRWGETRRFQSNTRKIARQNWLISKIAEARTS